MADLCRHLRRQRSIVVISRAIRREGLGCDEQGLLEEAHLVPFAHRHAFRSVWWLVRVSSSRDVSLELRHSGAAQYAQVPGEDWTGLWQIDGASKGSLMKQLVFRDEQNTDIHLALRPGKLANDFARFRKIHKGKPLRLIAWVCDPTEEAEINLVCADFLKGTQSELQELPGEGRKSIRGRRTCPPQREGSSQTLLRSL